MSDDRLLLPIIEAARKVGLGRSKFYELVSEGRVKTVRVGRRRLVSAAALDEFVASLETEGNEE